MVIEIGRLCEKTAGREAGSFCVVLDVLNDHTVLITGPRELTGVRRRKCNIAHLRPAAEIINIEKGCPDAAVADAMQEMLTTLGTKLKRKATKNKAPQEKPQKKKSKAPKKDKTVQA